MFQTTNQNIKHQIINRRPTKWLPIPDRPPPSWFIQPKPAPAISQDPIEKTDGCCHVTKG